MTHSLNVISLEQLHVQGISLIIVGYHVSICNNCHMLNNMVDVHLPLEKKKEELYT
jgi:hypothetical protein